MKLTARQWAILALLVVFALIAVSPVLVFNSARSAGSSDPAYQALKVFARSQNGDRAADAAAAEIFPTLKRRVVDGSELFSRMGANGVCWELNLSRSDRPYETEPANCES